MNGLRVIAAEFYSGCILHMYQLEPTIINLQRRFTIEVQAYPRQRRRTMRSWEYTDLHAALIVYADLVDYLHNGGNPYEIERAP